MSNELHEDARRITVIGAGIVGIACAISLQRDGHQVTVVDRLGPGGSLELLHQAQEDITELMRLLGD